ncbi:hypothetical protein D1P53_004470 [Cryptococcus gattii VGV]|nr:hypothetical protein D1P53_004470 [Cryptococcus gattii VGV]
MPAGIPTEAPAAVWYKHGEDAIIEQRPVPSVSDLKPGEVSQVFNILNLSRLFSSLPTLPLKCLIRLLYTGVCHSDLSNSNNIYGRPGPLPMIFGHEGSGHVVAIGQGTKTSLKIGDRVGVKYIQDACLECEMCRKGYESSCFNGTEQSGNTVMGTFQHYCVSFTKYVTPIPEGIGMDEAAPVLCAGVTVLRGIKEAQLSIGDWVAVPGAGGGLGHLAVQYAIALGYRVVGIDTGPEKQKLIESYGGNFLDFRKEENIVASIKKVTDGRGAHAAIVSAASEAAYTSASDYLRDRGSLIIVGLPANAELRLPILETALRGIKVVGCYVGNRQDAVEALQLHASGRAKLLYELERLENVNQILARLHAGKVTGRVVIDMTQ